MSKKDNQPSRAKTSLSASDKSLLAGKTARALDESLTVTGQLPPSPPPPSGGLPPSPPPPGLPPPSPPVNTRTTPSGHTYTYNANLSQTQLDAADKIVDYAFAHGFTASQASLSGTVAYAESSLGTITNNPNSTATGLFQYTQGTWSDRHSSLNINSESDQITAFYEDLAQLQAQYNNGSDANGNSIPSGVNLPDYVYTKFHYGWNSQNYTGSDVTSFFNGKESELGMNVQ